MYLVYVISDNTKPHFSFIFHAITWIPPYFSWYLNFLRKYFFLPISLSICVCVYYHHHHHQALLPINWGQLQESYISSRSDQAQSYWLS